MAETVVATLIGAAGSAYAGSKQRSAANKAARRQKEAAEARQRAVDTATGEVNTAFEPYNDKYFSGIADQYQKYATPQLDDQYNKTLRQLTYSLSRSGQLNSSERARQLSEAQKVYDLNATNIAAQGNQFANTTRANVESTRNNLLGQLSAAENPGAIAQTSINQAQSAAAAPAFNPLSDVFGSYLSTVTPNIQAGAQTRAVKEAGAQLFNNVGKSGVRVQGQ